MSGFSVAYWIERLEISAVEAVTPVTSYQTNKCVNAPTCEKPVHKRAWGRHHVGVFLCLLYGFLLRGKLWPVLALNLLLQPFAMRGRIEPRGLLEDPRLRGTGRRISTDG